MLGLSAPDFVPYAGCEGKWVPNSLFYKVGKSFGYFTCEDCNKSWMSAHAQKKFRQACKECFEDTYPSFMW